MLPLSKLYNPADYAELEPELQLVDQIGIEGQHESRRWEYALALQAVATWEKDRQAHVAVDVGGAGSQFYQMLGDQVGTNVTIVDPAYEPRPRSLESHVHRNPALADVVTCLSVLEHVDHDEHFLYHLSCLVAPGGLLVLTVDYAPQEGPDTYHWHWMRKRIYTPKKIEVLNEHLRRWGFWWFGWVAHQPQTFQPLETWGYAPASIVVTKRA